MQIRNLVAFVALAWSGCLLSPDGPCNGGGVRVPPDNLCECPDGSVLKGRQCVKGEAALALDASMPEADALPPSDANLGPEDGGMDAFDGLDSDHRSLDAAPAAHASDAATTDTLAPDTPGCDAGEHLAQGMCVKGCPTDACMNGNCVETLGDYVCRCNNGFAGTGTKSCVPIPTDVAVGSHHSCAPRTDGSVICWGRNESAQLGDGTTNSSSVPVVVAGLAGAQKVSAGARHTCMLSSAGDVKCWGDNLYGQLGNGMFGYVGNGAVPYSTSPVPVVGLADVVEIAAGSDHTCARKSNGEVVCWGLAGLEVRNELPVRSNVPVRVPGIANSEQVDAGEIHTCARRSSRDVVCWGDNEDGQLGNDTSGIQTVPAGVQMLTDVVQVSAGYFHTCAVTASRGVVCWGRNFIDGLLGDGTTADSRVPVAVAGINDAVQVSSGKWHSCARRFDTSVVCWGSNLRGRLGNGLDAGSNTRVDVTGLTNVIQVSSGEGHTCAYASGGMIYCWGENEYGQLGDGSTDDSSIPVQIRGS